MEPAGPLDVVESLRIERAAFLDLLRSLTPDEWRLPTECPAYDVQGVATHVLGDDLSLLSRQRDAAPSGLLAMLEPGDDFRTVLDRFNDRWVVAASFFAPALLVDLLDVSGEWTADFYAGVDPLSPGEPVGLFAATGPSPYWQIAAREYVERWVHHHQIRRATGRPDLADDEILAPAAATMARVVAAHLGDVGAADGDTLVLAVHGLASWTLLQADGGWRLLDGRPDGPTTAELRLGREQATPVLSRALPADDVGPLLAVTDGADGLGRRAARRFAAVVGRP